MSIATELTKLEKNRSDIVSAVNDKGGTLADNAPLSAVPSAIGAIETGRKSQIQNTFDGSVDADGLREIGWSEEDIKEFQANVSWYAWEDENYAVTEQDKAAFADKYASQLPERYFGVPEGMTWAEAVKKMSNPSPVLAIPGGDVYSRYSIKFPNVVFISSSFGKWQDVDARFFGCTSLRSVPTIPNDAPTGPIDAMFMACNSLLYAPVMDTSKVTLMPWMFRDCTSLRAIPQYDYSNCTSLSAFLFTNNSLKRIPPMNTAKVTAFDSAFGECSALQIVESIDMASATKVNMVFSNCTSLTTCHIDNLPMSISFQWSPKLANESILYIINHAGTATLTITLHNTAYANATADDEITAALAEKTNITLASA